MAPTLPADFPPAAAAGLEKVRRIHAPTWLKAVEFIGLNWGDLDAIDEAKEYWKKEEVRAKKAVNQMRDEFAKLSSVDTVAFWEGNAREAYAAWLSDFQSGTLEKYLTNVGQIIAKLEEIHGNIYSIRAHLIAMTFELVGIVAGLAAGETGVGLVAAVIALVAALGTWADFAFRVRGDLDEKGRQLEAFRVSNKVDRGNGSVSRPFKTDVIGDWSNWEKKT